jgi:ubiquinone/menaquinone biosynthesis C-methylase UbiE
MRKGLRTEREPGKLISEPYKDIPKEIVNVLEDLITPEDSYHQGHKRRMARTLDVLLKEKPKGKLLELGTSKVIPLSLQQLAPDLEVHVTDFDKDLPLSGTSTISIKDKTLKATTYRVDLETEVIPVEDATFDVVICCEVIEHMELDPMFMLAEINRVLKPNGKLILTTPNITSSRALYKMLRGTDPYFYMQYRHKPALYRHNYEYSEYSLRQVVKAAGFSGQVWTEDSFEDGVMEDITRLRQLGYPLTSIGDNIFATLTKTRGVVNRYPSVIYAD